MAIPSGAYEVVYHARYYNGDVWPAPPVHVELDTSWSIPFDNYPPELNEVVNDAVSAAMITFKDYMESHYPDAPGGVFREYKMRSETDADWPAS